MATYLAGDVLHRDPLPGDGHLHRQTLDSPQSATGADLTREEAHSRCPADSYVERYGSQWLIIPFTPVEQPRFFVCRPGDQTLSA